jgi:hypothetical protein
VIPTRRLASIAGDQGIPLFEAAMSEWDAQSATSPPLIASVTREILKSSPVEGEKVQDVRSSDTPASTTTRGVTKCACGHSRDVHYYPELPGQPACSECPYCRKFKLVPDVRRES